MDEFKAWAARGPLIGIDEGGPARNRFDFLIDLLPGPSGFVPANIFAPRLLPLPKNRRSSFLPAEDPVPGDEIPAGEKSRERRPFRILVSFGAEDPGGLAPAAARALIPSLSGKKTLRKIAAEEKSPGSFPVEITVLAGKRNAGKALFDLPKTPGLLVREAVPELREHLAEYDLLITHFGLTAFEALHARLPVILLSPGPYHERLARRASLVSAGRGKGRASRIPRLIYRGNSPGGIPLLNLDFLKTLGLGCEKTARDLGLPSGTDGASPRSLGEFIAALTPLVPPACPACAGGGRTGHRVLARFPDRTYRQCPRCGMVYMLRTDPPPIEYETDYFFDFYKKQYGKTYQEDFPHLMETGKIRLREIAGLLGKDGAGEKGPSGENLSSRGGRSSVKRLLDIGCAYGPFLAAAREGGFAPLGIDPAEDAIRYVREELRIPALTGFFPDLPAPELGGAESFDVVTLWYVIEHFQDPRRVLGEISRLLKKGGVLAFSTPSFSGISGRSSRGKFLERSPPDHWTIWTPRYCRRLLRLYGFELKKIAVTGHHPERFPLLGPRLSGKQGPAYRFFLWISRIFRWGDTFEVYAVKKEDIL
jgi:2-polyprenyl-3-methyl-5-hydroxy-6-metoxy-1,4-benzoquinol methylase